MEIKATSIDLTKVQDTAEESFRKGFFCCEAVMETIIDAFGLDVPREVIGMASGMAVGVGKSGCICGAPFQIQISLNMISFIVPRPFKTYSAGF